MDPCRGLSVFEFSECVCGWWVEQMKNKEIAAELGTSPNVVAVQVNSIRRKLKNGLGSQYPFSPESGKEGTYDNG